MTRREFWGCLLLVMLVLAGRVVRHALLVDASGGWREPGWLASCLPETADPIDPASDAPAAASPRLGAASLDPNTCSVDSLCLLPGIGPALAARIAAAREAGVHFACARDLQAVRGIGPRTVERLAPYLAFVEADSVK